MVLISAQEDFISSIGMNVKTETAVATAKTVPRKRWNDENINMPLRINITGISGSINALPLFEVDVRAAKPNNTVKRDGRYFEPNAFLKVTFKSRLLM